jgi:hypothetical protein
MIRTIKAGVCHINSNKHQTHSFISSFMSTDSMFGTMVENGEKHRCGYSREWSAHHSGGDR